MVSIDAPDLSKAEPPAIVKTIDQAFGSSSLFDDPAALERISMLVQREPIFGVSAQDNALKAQTQPAPNAGPTTKPAPVLRPDSEQYQEAVASLTKMITAQAVQTDAAVKLLGQLSVAARMRLAESNGFFLERLDAASQGAVIDKASYDLLRSLLTAQDDYQPGRYQRAQRQLEKAITREKIDIDATCEVLRSTSAGERLAIKRGFGFFQGLLDNAVSQGQIQAVEKWAVMQLVCGFDAKVWAEELHSAPKEMTEILKAMSGEQAYVTAHEYRRRYGEDAVLAGAKAGANAADVMRCIQHLYGEKALIAAEEWRRAGSLDKQGKNPVLQVIGALDSQDASLSQAALQGIPREQRQAEISAAYAALGESRPAEHGPQPMPAPSLLETVTSLSQRADLATQTPDGKTSLGERLKATAARLTRSAPGSD